MSRTIAFGLAAFLFPCLLGASPPTSTPPTVIQVYQPVLDGNAIRLVPVPYRAAAGEALGGAPIAWTCRPNAILDPDGTPHDLNLASRLGITARVAGIRSPGIGPGHADTAEVELDLSAIGDKEEIAGVPARSLVAAIAQCLGANASRAPGVASLDVRIEGSEKYPDVAGYRDLNPPQDTWWWGRFPFAEREVKTEKEVYRRAEDVPDAVRSATEADLVLFAPVQVMNFKDWHAEFTDEIDLYPVTAGPKRLRPEDLAAVKEVLLGEHEFVYEGCGSGSPPFGFVLRGRFGTVEVAVHPACHPFATARGDRDDTAEIPLSREQLSRLGFVMRYFPEDSRLVRMFSAAGEGGGE